MSPARLAVQQPASVVLPHLQQAPLRTQKGLRWQGGAALSSPPAPDALTLLHALACQSGGLARAATSLPPS